MPAEEEARRLAETAQKYYQKKDYPAAANQYRLAADVLHANGDDIGAAEMENNRAVALTLAGEYQTALEATRGTEKVFLAAGDERRAGLAFGNQAAALEGLGKKREALELYERSADLLKRSGDSASRTAVLKSMTALQARSGDSFQALASAQAALNTGAALSTREKLLKKLIDIPIKMLNRR